MGDYDAPYEWVHGRSQIPWLAGYLGVFLGLFGLIYAGLVFVFPLGSAPYDTRQVLLLQFILQMSSIGVAWPISLLYAWRVPMPVEWLGITPSGVRLNSNEIHPVVYPWSQLRLDGDRLTTFSRWFHVRLTFRLTAEQTRRFEFGRSCLAPVSTR